VAAVFDFGPQVARDRIAPPEMVGTAAISGRVTIDVNGEPQPVRRAKVTLESSARRGPQHTDTDTDGRYPFERLPEGEFRVRAEKAGFVPRVLDPRRVFELSPLFTVGTGQVVTRDLSMVRGAALEGRITTTTGAPVPNVVVSAVRLAYDATGRRPVPVRQTRTDDRGHFRVHTLPAGEYYLDAAPDPVASANQTPVAGQVPTVLERTYYPGAPQVEGGRTIALSTGQNIADLAFSLPVITTAALRGRVIDSTGGAPSAWFVRLQRVGGPVGEVRGSSNPDGNDFIYPRVPPGDYWLMGVTRATASTPLEFAASRLTVVGQDLTDLVVTTMKGASVAGHLVVESGTLPAGVALHVSPMATAFELPVPFTEPGGLPMPPAPVGTDGAFAFPSLFGPLLLRVIGLPPGWVLKSVTVDGADVTDTPVDFRPGATVREARLVITSRTSSVIGVVRDDAGRPVERARVVIFSEDDRTWGWRSRLVHSTEADAEVRYALTGLLAGRYRIVSVPYLEQGSWMDVTILSRLLPLAGSLVVEDGRSATMNLVGKPW
jgi:hypothetical protein